MKILSSAPLNSSPAGSRFCRLLPIAMLAILGACGVQETAQAQTNQRFIRDRTAPRWATGDKIIFVAAEWRGRFTYGNAEDTFWKAVRQLKKKDLSCRQGRFDRRMAYDRHAVLGWYNASRKRGNWVAVRIRPGGTSSQYFTNDYRPFTTTSGWKILTWRDRNTNGHTIRIQFGDDDRGGLATILHPIR